VPLMSVPPIVADDCVRGCCFGPVPWVNILYSSRLQGNDPIFGFVGGEKGVPSFLFALRPISFFPFACRALESLQLRQGGALLRFGSGGSCRSHRVLQGAHEDGRVDINRVSLQIGSEVHPQRMLTLSFSVLSTSGFGSCLAG